MNVICLDCDGSEDPIWEFDEEDSDFPRVDANGQLCHLECFETEEDVRMENYEANR